MEVQRESLSADTIQEIVQFSIVPEPDRENEAEGLLLDRVRVEKSLAPTNCRTSMYQEIGNRFSAILIKRYVEENT